MSEPQQNTDLYNLRVRLSKSREGMRFTGDKIVEHQQKIDEVKQKQEEHKSTLDTVETRVKVLEDKLQTQSDDVVNHINSLTSEQIQPLLDELCTDLENAINEIKLLKQRVVQLEMSNNDDVSSSKSEIRPVNRFSVSSTAVVNKNVPVVPRRRL